MPANCGNGTIDAAEQCDGVDLGGEDCETLLGQQYGGIEGSSLACTPLCAFDTERCTLGGMPCGSEQQCDFAGGGLQCSEMGFADAAGIMPDCLPNCTPDITACTGHPDCGNGVAEGAEPCDGSDVPTSCDDWTLPPGTLTCAPGCVLDFSGCTG